MMNYINLSVRIKIGVLTVELDKSTYERCGLVGYKCPDKSRKHAKLRFRKSTQLSSFFASVWMVISIVINIGLQLDFRRPSMSPGKKAFERIVQAFRATLNDPVVWLVSPNEKLVDILGKSKHPDINYSEFLMAELGRSKVDLVNYLVPPDCIHLGIVVVPQILLETIEVDKQSASELLDWLGLLLLCTEKVRDPDIEDRSFNANPEHEVQAVVDMVTQNLTRMRWHAFMTPSSVEKIVSIVLNIVTTDWVSVHVSSFGRATHTLLSFPKRKQEYHWRT